MNLMIMSILLIGAASLSSQSPIVDKTTNLNVFGDSAESDDLQTAPDMVFLPRFYFKRMREIRRRLYLEHHRQKRNDNIFGEPFDTQYEELPQERFTGDLQQDNIFAKISEKTRNKRNADDDLDDLETAEDFVLPYFRYKKQTAFWRNHRPLKNKDSATRS